MSRHHIYNKHAFLRHTHDKHAEKSGGSDTRKGFVLLMKLAPVLAVTLFAGIETNASTRLPRLVVNITVDGLRSDFMEAFMPLYGEDGFRKLLKEGRVYTHAEYPSHEPTRSSSVATIATGAVPYDHGIISTQWLDRNTLRPVYCVDDNQVQGLKTGDCFSPRNLVVSTIGDELKVATEGKALVYAISPYSDAAVLSAGHAADGAFWIDQKSGNWVGSSYYSETLPAWVTLQNDNGLPSTLHTITWKPASDLGGNFSYFLGGGVQDPFAHRFKGEGACQSFLTSGLINEYTVALAQQSLQYTGMGRDDVPDYLAITLWARGFEDKPISNCPMEVQDTYVRLDKALASLISAAEQTGGKGNTLFVLTSTGTQEEENADLSRYRIPTGTFYINRTASILNIMLMAVYGQGNYVEATYGNQIYLNHKLIEDKQLSMTDVLDRCQELLLQSQGVKDAYSSQRLLMGAWTPGISKIRNGYNPRLSGDILVQVAPGWKLINETTHQQRLVRESYLNFPIIFYGLDLPAQTIETTVSTDCIAPTLSSAMRIRAPNACHSAAFSGF